MGGGLTAGGGLGGGGGGLLGGGGILGQPQQQGPQSPFSQSQQNYITNQGKLPGFLGGQTLGGAQQNFFNAKGYLPGGVQGDKIGQQYYHNQQPQQGVPPDIMKWIQGGFGMYG